MTKASLSSCYTTDMGVHLTQLISESVKASIHALKLHHDCLQGHITHPCIFLDIPIIAIFGILMKAKSMSLFSRSLLCKFGGLGISFQGTSI